MKRSTLLVALVLLMFPGCSLLLDFGDSPESQEQETNGDPPESQEQKPGETNGSPCTKETDSEFCDRQGKKCGAFSGIDNCGESRVVECGSCCFRQTCDGNACIQPSPTEWVDWDIPRSKYDFGFKNNDIVFDRQTCLMWQRNLDPQPDSPQNALKMTFEDASKYCENLVRGGYDDWRLPTVTELKSILDRSQARAVNKSYFFDSINAIEPDPEYPDYSISRFWASTPYHDLGEAWTVCHLVGQNFSFPKTEKYFVRCVR